MKEWRDNNGEIFKTISCPVLLKPGENGWLMEKVFKLINLRQRK